MSSTNAATRQHFGGGLLDSIINNVIYRITISCGIGRKFPSKQRYFESHPIIGKAIYNKIEEKEGICIVI